MRSVLTRLIVAAITLALAWTATAVPARAATTGPDGQPITNQAGVRFGILSHRGGANERPENSLEAITYSAAQGFDGIEVDLLFTRDGWPVLSHYDTLPKRCTSAGAKIHLLTWAELGGVRCQDRAGAFTVPIPDFYLLVDALRANPEVGLTLDIKTYSGQSAAGKRDYATRAMRLLTQFGLVGRTRILSFSWSTALPTIRKWAPSIYVLALDNKAMDLARVRKAAKLGANGYGIKMKDSSAYLLRYTKSLGLDATPWEVKGEQQRSMSIHFGGSYRLFSSDSPTSARKSLLAGKYDLDPVPQQVFTPLAAPALVVRDNLKAGKKKYPKVLGAVVPDGPMMLETVTVRVSVKAAGKGYLSVSPSGGTRSSEVRRKLPKGAAEFILKVPVGDGGRLRVFTSKKTTIRVAVLGYTRTTFAG